MRIFVTGFQRSGTTLLRRLLHNHPEIECMIHERRIMNLIKTKDDVAKVVKMYKKWEGSVNGNWGEKVPWQDTSGKEIISYCKKWNNIFVGDNPKIIHIIRNPISIGLSNVKLGWFPTIDKVIHYWNLSIPDVVSYMNTIDNGLTIIYEDLVINKRDVLDRVYRFCGLDHSDSVLNKACSFGREELRYFDKVEPSRAFSYTECGNKYNYIIENYKQMVDKYLVGTIGWE